MKNVERKLNIFIDEAGTQSPCGDKLIPDNDKPQESFYIVSFVFHREYKNDIFDFLKNVYDLYKKNGFNNGYIHFSPLIHGSKNYKNVPVSQIRELIFGFNDCLKELNVKIKTIIVDKTVCKNEIQLLNLLKSKYGEIVKEHTTFFNSSDGNEIYYDNGQEIINKLINECVALYKKPTRKKTGVSPKNYMLLQVCDFVCSMNVLNIKIKAKRLTKRENLIFKDTLRFKKEIIDTLKSKKL